MPILNFEEIEQWVEAKIASSGAAVSIYEPRYGNAGTYPNHQYLPHCMYFFYIRVNGNGALKVDHYFYHRGPPDSPQDWPKIPLADIDGLVTELALNARPTGKKVPPPLPDHNFERIVVRRRSYLVFFLDEANWAFHKRGDTTFAMAFNIVKSGAADNYSFFDARDVELTLPISTGGEDKRTGVCLINHMKSDAAGTDLNAPAPFAFDMYFNVKFADPTTQRLTVIFDPGGTNLGPSQQP